MIVSRYMEFLRLDPEQSFVWNSVFGNPMLTSDCLASYLWDRQCSDDPKINLTEIRDEFELSDSEVKELVNELIDAHIIVESSEDEDREIANLFFKYNQLGTNKVRSLSLIMSEECNFRCKYCIHFANSNHRYNPEKFMKEDLAKKAIDDYLEIAKRNKLDEAYINFGGGEPLLNWKTISTLLDYIEDRRKSSPIPIKLGINTNISLMTEEIAKKLIAHNVEIAASLDGFRKGNNAVRLSKDLTGTYDRIMNGFRILSVLGRPLNGFAMTVTEDNFSDVSKDLIKWGIKHNMTEIRIDVDVVGMVNLPVKEIARKLTAVRKYAKKHGVSVIGFWSRAAENMGLNPEVSDIGFCGGERGNSLCVAPSGQVFPCGYSNYELCTASSILDIANSQAYQNLLSRRNLLKAKNCKGCPILGFCRGGCLITQEANQGTSSDKIKRMCELYRLMTYSILRESVDVDFT